MSGERPLDRDEFRRWREEADRALHQAALAQSERVYNWACFLAEQAAQLAVKALLHGLGRGPWGHDLAALGEQLAAAGLDVSPQQREALLRLARHYAAARYPDAHAGGSPGERYSSGDADQALADARDILRVVDGAWDELDR